MPRRTTIYLSQGERKVLGHLIRRKPKTWTELLEKTGLSKAGLSKVLKKLKKYGLIEEVLIKYNDRKYKAYRATVDSFIDAETRALLYDFLSSLDNIITKQHITKNDAKEALETIIEYSHYMILLIIDKMISKRTSTRNIAIYIESLIKPVVEKIRQNKQLYDLLHKNYLDLILEEYI